MTPPFPWDEWYREHAPRLRRVIARRVDSRDVEDVLQETFARAYRSRHTLDPARPIGAWLTTIAVRAAIDARRVVDERPLSEAPEAEVADASAPLLAAEQQEAIASAFGGLSARQRRFLRSHAVEDLSQAVIARQEGLAPEAVRAAILRARRRFRKGYERLVRDTGLAGVPVAFKSSLLRLRRWIERSNLSQQFEGLVAVSALAIGMLAGPAHESVVLASTDSLSTGARIPSARSAPATGHVPRGAPTSNSTEGSVLGSATEPRRPRPTTAVDEPSRKGPSTAVTFGETGGTWTVTTDTRSPAEKGSVYATTWTHVNCSAGVVASTTCAALNPIGNTPIESVDHAS